MEKQRNTPTESNRAIYDQAQESLNESFKNRLIADNERYSRRERFKRVSAVTAVVLGLLIAGKMDADSEKEMAKTTPPVELVKKKIAKTKANNELREWMKSQEESD